MDKFSISKEICKKYNITISELAGLLFLASKGDYDKFIASANRKGLIAESYVGKDVSGYTLMDKGKQLLDTILLESADNIPSDDRLISLASQLRDVFPEGKKEGTAFYWRGNSREVINRLRSFFIKFGDYSDEEIIDAAHRYVNAFMTSGTLKNMRLLKYFIWKRVDVGNGLEEASDLLTFIENADNDEFYNSDWTSRLR